MAFAAILSIWLFGLYHDWYILYFWCFCNGHRDLQFLPDKFWMYWEYHMPHPRCSKMEVLWFHSPTLLPFWFPRRRSCIRSVLFEFIRDLVYFPSFKLGLDTSRHYWFLFLHFHNFWATSSQFQITDFTLGWFLCLWRIHGLYHSILDTKRRLDHGFSCYRRISSWKITIFISGTTFGVSELHSVCNIGLSYSMLGFGDIIIPGFLGGYCAYFDLLNVHAHYYYWWTFIFSYGFGLILTFVALILMATGQPALFFLVPSTVGSLLLCAYVRKETNFFWNGPKLKESLN